MLRVVCLWHALTCTRVGFLLLVKVVKTENGWIQKVFYDTSPPYEWWSTDLASQGQPQCSIQEPAYWPPQGCTLLENMAILHGYYSAAVCFPTARSSSVFQGVPSLLENRCSSVRFFITVQSLARPTGVVTQCSKIVCSSMSSGNAVFTAPPRPPRLGCVWDHAGSGPVCTQCTEVR